MSVAQPRDRSSNPFERIRPIPPLSVDDEGRFWDKVRRSDDLTGADCWWWTASGLPSGYGLFSLKGQRYYAHRVSYSLFFGDAGPLILDHKCENGPRGCVRPVHLQPVTAGENVLLSQSSPCAINARKTRCKRGHEFNDENTLWGKNPNGRPKRRCRVCRRMQAAKYRAARKVGAEMPPSTMAWATVRQPQ